MNGQELQFIALVLLGGFVLWSIWRFQGLAFIYDIRLADEGISFVLFFAIPIGFVSFSNIKFVREVKGGYTYWSAYNFKNRFGHATFVIEKKKSVFSKQVLVTPEDADVFTRALAQAGVNVIREEKR